MRRLYPVANLSVILAAAGMLHAQSVTVSPNQINLSAQVNGPQVTQNLTVSSSGGSVNFGAFATSTNNWLTVSPQSGNTQLILTVTANPNGLAASNTPYPGSITIFGPFGNSIVVPVNLTVTSIGIAPVALAFSYQIGGSVPSAKR